VHAQFRELTLEVLGDLGISDRLDLARAQERVADEFWGAPAREAAHLAASGAARWVARWRRGAPSASQSAAVPRPGSTA